PHPPDPGGPPRQEHPPRPRPRRQVPLPDRPRGRRHAVSLHAVGCGQSPTIIVRRSVAAGAGLRRLARAEARWTLRRLRVLEDLRRVPAPPPPLPPAFTRPATPPRASTPRRRRGRAAPL